MLVIGPVRQSFLPRLRSFVRRRRRVPIISPASEASAKRWSALNKDLVRSEGSVSALLWIPCATRTMCLSSPVLAASLTCGRMNVSKPLSRSKRHVSSSVTEARVRETHFSVRAATSSSDSPSGKLNDRVDSRTHSAFSHDWPSAWPKCCSCSSGENVIGCKSGEAVFCLWICSAVQRARSWRGCKKGRARRPSGCKVRLRSF